MEDKGSVSRTSRSRRKQSPPVSRALRAIADDLVAWRKLRGLTQVQVAERAGVSEGTVRRLENGDGGISLENLLGILRALGLLESLPRALDPYETDLGRMRSEERLPQRVRPRKLTEADG
jgi:transcriptional regulator with XRE-family HTH domain